MSQLVDQLKSMVKDRKKLIMSYDNDGDFEAGHIEFDNLTDLFICFIRDDVSQTKEIRDLAGKIHDLSGEISKWYA